MANSQPTVQRASTAVLGAVAVSTALVLLLGFLTTLADVSDNMPSAVGAGVLAVIGLTIGGILFGLLARGREPSRSLVILAIAWDGVACFLALAVLVAMSL